MRPRKKAKAGSGAKIEALHGIFFGGLARKKKLGCPNYRRGFPEGLPGGKN